MLYTMYDATPYDIILEFLALLELGVLCIVLFWNRRKMNSMLKNSPYVRLIGMPDT